MQHGMRTLWIAAAVGCLVDTDPRPAPDVIPAANTIPAPVTPVYGRSVPARYGASHVLIAYAGAVHAPAHVTRSKTQAAALAHRLHRRIQQGKSLAAIANTHSDDPSGARGGTLGTMAANTMAPAFEAAIAKVNLGELTPVVETPFGFHLIRREPVVPTVTVRMLAISHPGGLANPSPDREWAKLVAHQLHARLRTGESFEQLARSPFSQVALHTGMITPGQVHAALEQVLFALGVGAHSDVLQTPTGCYMVERIH